ncbi:MAG: hypothetical protein WD771_01125 [Gemmatimonadaceae bacterium]
MSVRRCRPWLVLTLALGVIAACAPLRPFSRTAVGSGPTVRQQPDPLAAPWVLRDGGARRAQIIAVRALLTSELDATVRVDTLRSTMGVAWSAVPGTTPARLAGMVTDFRAVMGGDSSGVPAGVNLPFSFVAESRGPGLQPVFTIPESGSCTNPNAAVMQGVRDTWLSLPDTMVRGTTWRDSSTYLVCRDGLPMTVSAVRTFTVTGARMREGQLVVVVQRVTATQLAGSGHQFGEPIALLGEGEGTMQLDVALAGGVIVHGEGVAELRLEMQGRRRTLVLRQASTVEIREP